MYPIVLDAFMQSIADEGYTTWMYLDVECLVTCGRGNKIDPVAEALTLDWERPDGSLATGLEIITAWNNVKAHGQLRWLGGENKAFADLTSIRLTKASIDKLDRVTIATMQQVLATRLPQLDTWPADAQLALLRWAWANGPMAHYPKMFAALAAKDFATAAHEAEWTNETDETRQIITTHFMRAAAVVGNGDDPAFFLVAQGVSP
jgi:hypothetical protein